MAGLGGDSKWVRVIGDARYYHELFEDIVGIARVQAAHHRGYGGDDLRIIDHFFMGPSLVRGFAPSGIGPRDVSTPTAAPTRLGGTTYFGARSSAVPDLGPAARARPQGRRVFADAGTLFDYKGRLRSLATILEERPSTGMRRRPARMHQRARQQRDPLVGRRQHPVGVAARADPLRLRGRLSRTTGDPTPASASAATDPGLPLLRRPASSNHRLRPRSGSLAPCASRTMTEPSFFREPTRPCSSWRNRP